MLNNTTQRLRRLSAAPTARLALAAAALVGAAALAACAETVRTQAHPGLRALDRPIQRVAVAPFRVSGSLAARRPPDRSAAPTAAATLVTHHVGEALAARGVGVIPAADVSRTLALEGAPAGQLSPPAVAQRLHAQFGADAILLGEVWRYEERSGEAAGSLRPASVGFQVTLFSAPAGQKLWSGTFDETQRGLSENVLNAGRYPGGGTRWLTAEELLRWGARETANAIPLGP